MLVKELRNVISKYKSDEKDKIIIELYKRIPKKVKEDYDIDGFISDINKNTEVKKEQKILSIDELEKEVNYFIMCARQDLYCSSNRVISKKERSGWRFKAKRFYKDLNAFLPETTDGKKATLLLRDLFILLSYGTHYLTFSNWETFKAIQVPQSEYLETIIKRKLSEGINRDNLLFCVNLLDVEYDPYEYHKDMLCTFESCLKTTDMKYMAIDLLKEKVENYNEKIKNSKKDDYSLKEYHNYFVECIIDIYFNLCEVDDGIKYFHKNYIYRDKEIKEYILLELLDDFELYKDWIKEYESHIGKIDYRDSLKDRYKVLKKKKV